MADRPDRAATAPAATAPAAPTSDGPTPNAPVRRRPRSPRPLAALLPLAQPYAGRLLVALACLVVAALAGLAFPAVVRWLLDAAFVARDRALLDRLAVGLVLVFAVQGACNYVQVLLLSGTAERVLAALRARLFAHLVRLSPAFFTERRTGELTSRLSADLTLLQQLMNTWVSEFARQVLFLAGGAVLLTRTDPHLTLVTLAVTPVIVAVALVCGRALRRASAGVQDRAADASALADEAFSQIRTVQGFVREAEETRRYERLLGSLVSAALGRARVRAAFFGVVGFVAFAGVVAVLWEGGRRVLDGTLTAGALVSFLFYAFFIAAAVGSLASLFGNFQEAIGAAERVFELLSVRPTVAEPERPVALARPARGAVAFEGVSFRYAPGLPEVLHDVTLRAAPGEVVAIVGRSGAGKTTLASLLPRFWDADAGRVTLDGVDVRGLALGTLRGAVGVVPQEPALFSGTVGENVAYARPGATAAEVEAASRAAHAHEFVARLPQGYATPVGERGVKLSGGQRQRVAIARVFLKDPAVVVLDEATSSLDAESEQLVEEALERLLRGRTTLIIAHRLSTVRRADRVVVLDAGRVAEEGTHAELLARGGLYARLYRGQFREEDAVVVDA